MLSALPYFHADSHHYAGRNTPVEIPSTVVARIEQQAIAQPAAIAVVFENHLYTYALLNQQANQIASRLRRAGIGPGQRVGVGLPRSATLISVLLGILKAGAAYVPVDPAYPLERCRYMLADAEVAALITRTGLFTDLDDLPWRLDIDTAALEAEPLDNPSTPITLAESAYLIYTSGSTGRPKGVEIGHEALAHLIDWHVRAFGVTALDRATQLASISFDAAGWEMWPYLATGASVHVVEDDLRADPERLRDWLCQRQMTVAFAPTPLAERLMALPWPPTPALRFLLTGGDALHGYPPADLPFTLVNNYGPSEATVVATSGRVEPQSQPQRPPTIGRAIDHALLYVLDPQGQPVAPGDAGELYIGGAAVARGYWRQPALTTAVFLPDPFVDHPEARMYRTGDLVRQLADGQFEFLGRIDQQVKIRGYRIELEEIAAVLNGAPEVAQSVVAVHHTPAGEPQLVAYVVAQAAAVPTRSGLQSWLQRQLPDYMIPALFVQLGALPVTPNGKVDRAALPVPETATLLPEDNKAPTSAIEARLAAVIQDLLEITTLGLDDNFFLLGGHSMLGTQLVSRINHEYGVTLPLRQLFATPTIRQLSAQIEARLIEQIQQLSDDEVLRLLQQ